jgi:hypothetical protein
MPYLGNTPTTQSFISGTDYFNGTGSQTAFTLSRTVASVNDIQAVVNNVVQVPNDAYTISGTTITFTSAPSSGTQNVYVRYLSTTTQAITPSQNTVSWSTLDSNVQGDLGISFKNRIINGAMVIDQRNAGASVTPTDGQYSLDRWKCRLGQSSKYSVQQNAGSVTPPAGFTNYSGITSLSAFTPASGDYFNFQQLIEGFNFADCGWGTANAKTVTLSFWVRSSLTGTFAGRLANSAIDRVNVFTYSISAANTWEQKSITIAGDTSGTWVGATNGVGVVLAFDLGSGSSFETATTGSWITTDSIRTASSVRLISTNGATWYITGVQLEVGTQATTFTTAGGSYGAELVLCQRYYQIYATPQMRFFTNTTASSGFSISNETLPVTMRATPSISYSGNVTLVNIAANTSASVGLSVDGTSSNGFRFYPSSGMSTSVIYFLTGLNPINCSAEL